MSFLRTLLATDWEEELPGFIERLAGPIGEANPSYRGKYHLVRSWLIEFNEAGEPWREIALDARGEVVFAGPSAKDYGFWLDTNMKLADFSGEPVTQERFELLWTASGVTCP